MRGSIFGGMGNVGMLELTPWFLQIQQLPDELHSLGDELIARLRMLVRGE